MSNWFKRPTDSVFVALTPAERSVAIALLCVIGLLVGPFALGTGISNGFLLYGAFLIYLSVLALPFLWPRFRVGIFHPIVFYVIWVGIRGLLEGKVVLAASGLDYHRALGAIPSNELNKLAAEAFLLEGIALLALYAGYSFAPRFRFPVMALPRIGAPALKTAGWIGVSCAALWIFAAIGGGFDTVLMQRGMASDERIAAQIGGHWNFLATVGTIAPLVWLACKPRATQRPIFWLLLFAALAINFAVTGSRGGTIVTLIMIGSLWMLHHRKIPYKVILVGILGSLITVGSLGQYRAATQQASTFEQVDVKVDISDWALSAFEELQKGGTKNSGYIAVLGRVPESVPHLWGESYLSIPFIFIPSAVWGDKPDAAGKLNAIHIYERPLTAIPPGPVGEAYWNFSYIGVVLVFLLYGALLKLVATFYRTNPGHPLVITVFLYVLFNMQPHTPSIYEFFHAVIPALVILGTFVLPLDERLLRHNTRRRTSALS